MWVISSGSSAVMSNLDEAEPITFVLRKSSLAAVLCVNQ
jgi:hypothetical protein